MKSEPHTQVIIPLQGRAPPLPALDMGWARPARCGCMMRPRAVIVQPTAHAYHRSRRTLDGLKALGAAARAYHRNRH